MAKSKLFLIVTIIISTSGVEPKAPYPPSGLRPEGRSFNLPGEEQPLETTTQEITDYTTTEFSEGLNRLGRASDDAYPASDSLTLVTDEWNATTISPDDEITTFAPVDSEHKLIEKKTPQTTRLYPINEAKLGELRMSDEGDFTTFSPIDEESSDLKSQVESIEILFDSENAAENKTTKQVDAEEETGSGSDEKVVLDPALPPETRFERFYLVHDGKFHDYEYIQQYYDQSAKDEPLVISRQEVLLPFIYSAQVERSQL